MLELIDKIEALGKLQTMYIQIECACGDGNLVAKGVRKAYKAIERMPTIEAEPVRHGRWIPVEEALPELDTMVIVCYYGSDCIFPMQGETVTEAVARQNKVPTVTMGFLDEEGWNGADMFPMMIRPSFWMPLPKPPKRRRC